MAELLLFNIADPEKRTALRLMSLRLGLQCQEIPIEQQGRTIEELLNGTADESVKSAEQPFTDELMLMHALTQEDFHTLLDTLRREGQSIRLKAVVTDHNRKWTAQRLHQELCAEEEAIRKWKQQAHSGPKHKKK